jgi:class 3 adenylate cyclase/tetratricopeptide (TPR) repeat protein
MAMQCRKCGTDNSSDRQFCGGCGASLSDACPDCGFVNDRGANYCGHCGAAVRASPDATITPVAARRSPISSTLIRQILLSRDKRGNELKQVTILFADISESTALIDGLDPEEAAVRLEPILTALIDAVHANEGVVNRIQGDGIMALFGAPIALEDHALRACAAGLAIQEAVAAAGADAAKVRVGLNSGEVLVRSVNNDLSIDYDAVGSTVHLASRMEQLAAPGSVLLTGNTYRLAEGFIEVQPLGPSSIKGMKEPAETYELTGTIKAKTRWDARVARGLTRFVGRDAELDLLSEVLGRAKAGQGQVVALHGGPGVGKSRLVHELLHSELSSDWAVFDTAAMSGGRNPAYLPISNLLRAWFAIGADDAAETIVEKVKTKTEAAHGAKHLPAICSLLDIAGGDEQWERLDAYQRRRRIMDAFRTIILDRAEKRPLILIIEDLHWADTESLAVLDHLVGKIGDANTLLLVTCRPEHHLNWTDQANFTALRIDPLEPDMAGRLLDSMLGGDHHLDQLKRKLIERSEGTPLFLEEMVRSLIETGALKGKPGAYRMARRLDEIRVPATVQSVLAARVDRLRPELKSLLQLASVIGKDVPVALLQGMANTDVAALEPQLAQLQASELLYPSKGLQQRRVSFNHDLTREVTYEGIPFGRRRELHALVVRTVEMQSGERLDEYVDRLAHHALKGGLWEKAVDYHLQAGMRAIFRSANREAVALFEDALEAVKHLPRNEAREKSAIDLRLMANTAMISLGELERMIEILGEAEALAKGIDDRRRFASVNTQLSIAHWLRGHHQQALAAGKAALATAVEIEHPALQLAASFNIGMAYHGVGEFEKAIRYHDGIYQKLTGDLRLHRVGWAAYPIVFVHTFMASSYIERGDYAAAKRHVDEGCEFADAMMHPYSQAMIYDYRGYYLLSRGQVEDAITVFERALDYCRDYEILNLYRSVAAKLGTAYARCGRADEAIALLEPVTDLDDFLKGGTYIWLWLFLGLGEAYLASGRIDDALAIVDRGVELTSATGEHPHHAYALRLLGQIEAARGTSGVAKAEQCYRDAIAEAETCAMRPLAAHCRQDLGKLLIDSNQKAKAARELESAAQGFEDLDLPLFRDEARSLLARLEPTTA